MSVDPATWPPGRTAVLVFLTGLICYFPWPMGMPMEATEAHRGITAHQMVESHQWLVPTLYGHVYLAKPPLHYWIEASFEWVSGVATPFIWRLPAAIEGAALGAFLALMAGRWFGRLAAIVCGFSYIALFTLWGENHGADIDVSNTVASVVASLCIIELCLGTWGRRWFWGAVLAIGAMWMVKGPAGLTIVGGAWLWTSWVRMRRDGKWLLRPMTWGPLLLGTAILGVYALVARWYLVAHHLPVDVMGVEEATQGEAQAYAWLNNHVLALVLGPTMFVFALPVSLALPMALRRRVRAAVAGTVQGTLMTALAASVLLGWALGTLEGMHNPRYAFVTLPLLCPLAGGVAAICAAMGAEERRKLRIMLGWCLAAYGPLAVGLVFMCWRQTPERTIPAGAEAAAMLRVAVVGAGIAVVVATWAAISLWRGRWGAAWAAPVLFVAVAIPHDSYRYFYTIARECRPQGALIRNIAGPDATLISCAMVLDQPDVFYYSGLHTVAMPGDTLLWQNVPLNSWVVLKGDQREFGRWKKEVPERMHDIHAFTANRNPGYLVWYALPTGTKTNQ